MIEPFSQAVELRKKRWLERARQTQCCDSVIDGLIGEAIEIISLLSSPKENKHD